MQGIGICSSLVWLIKCSLPGVGLWQRQSEATEATNVSIRFSWSIWQALVSLWEFEIKYFHSLNALHVGCTSYRIQTSTNVLSIVLQLEGGSWLLTTATLAWYPVSACTQTQISGRNMKIENGAWMQICKSPSQMVISGLWALQQVSLPHHG